MTASAGTVKLFFQPAEEADGGLQTNDRSRLHGKSPRGRGLRASMWGEYLAAGQVGAKKGGINAYSDEFSITVRGKKSPRSVAGRRCGRNLHSQPSSPPDCMACAAVGSVPTEAVALNVGTFHGGLANNIICDEVKLSVMFRTMDVAVRERVALDIERLVRGICEANGAAVDFERRIGCDCQINKGLSGGPAGITERSLCWATGHFETFRWQGSGN